MNKPQELDKFLNDSTTIEYILKGKKITGDVSAFNLLKLQALANEKLTEAEQVEKTFEIVFGKENTKLLSQLQIQKIIEITEDVAKAFGNETEEKK